MKNVLFIIALFIAFTFNLTAYSGSGDGSEGNPIQISNANDLIQLMGGTSDDWSKHFILTTNVNVSGRDLYPIGDVSTSFTGSFNGQGYKIYSSPSSNTIELGFFGNNAQTFGCHAQKGHRS